jgi:hypothetical protein
VDQTLRGRLRARLGSAARDHLRQAEGARGDSPRRRVDRAPRGAASGRRAPGPGRVCLRRRGLAKGGTVTLYYDGEQTGQGTLAATAPIGFSPNETAGIGHELGTTVLPGTAPADTVFNGKISWVRLTTGQPDNSDMVDPEDVINMLMAEQ